MSSKTLDTLYVYFQNKLIELFSFLLIELNQEQ